MNISAIPAAISDVPPSSAGSSSMIPVPQGGTADTDTMKKEAAPAQELSNEQIKKMVEDIQERLTSMRISLNFSRYGENNEKIAVVVSDTNTGEVIREIPSNELQQLYLKMNELIGMLFNGAA